MQRHFDELDERGYTLLEQVLTQSQIEEAIAELRRSYEEEFVSAHAPGPCRTTNLTARAPVFRDLIQLPEVVACMSHLLGEDYVLADMGARAPLPGIAAQGLPRAGGPAGWAGPIRPRRGAWHTGRGGKPAVARRRQPGAGPIDAPPGGSFPVLVSLGKPGPNGVRGRSI